MKKQSHIYIILIALLLFIQQIISGCTAPVSKDLYKKDLYKEEELVDKNLFKDKCSLCHKLPDIDAYPYTPEQWASVVDYMHDAKEARAFMTTEE